MGERRNLVEFLQSEQIECPMCGTHNVQTTIEAETFPYGSGSDTVELTAHVPVRMCNDCGFQFTDEVAEEARHKAVCRHLRVMSPKEIVEIRKAYRMSRADFARLTRIGEASLARWENGLLIQSPAYDQFLYLLTYPENLERLKSRKPGERSSSVFGAASQTTKQEQRLGRLRSLQVTEKDKAAAKVFKLRPTGT